MYEFGGVQVMQCFGSLVYDVSFVLLTKHIFPYEGVEVDIHKLEEDVDISLIAGSDDLFQLHDVRMLELL
jgi:hypothetical protein